MGGDSESEVPGEKWEVKKRIEWAEVVQEGERQILTGNISKPRRRSRNTGRQMSHRAR